jgi:hypothetical protein
MEGLRTGAGSVVPDSEGFRRAIRWISERREERLTPSISELISEASRQFDLSPREEASLRALLIPAEQR